MGLHRALVFVAALAMIWGCSAKVDVTSGAEAQPQEQSKPVAADEKTPKAEPALEDTNTPIPLNQAAPDIELASLDGKEKLKLSDLKGKIVMIDFWATWCPPCREGLPITNKLHEKYGKQGLQVLTVSNEDAETVKKFVAENKYSFPAYLDPNSAAMTTYKVKGIPTLVVIDAEGKVSSYMIGLHPEADVMSALEKAGLKA